MFAIVPHPVPPWQPHSVRLVGYRYPAMESDPKKLLWRNICALMDNPEGKDPSIDEVTKKTKVGRGTVQRIKEGNTSCGLDVLAKISAAFGIEPWQLLVPGVKRSAVPALSWSSKQASGSPVKPPSSFKDGPITLTSAELGLIQDLRMLDETGRIDEVESIYKTVHESAGVAKKMKDHILRKYLPAKDRS